MKELYDITRTLAGNRRNLSKPVKDKEGRTINKEVEQRSRWEEHFKEILNKEQPAERSDIPTAETLLCVNTNPPSKAEKSKALKMLKDGKTSGPGGIPPEALKADPITTTDMLHHLFLKIWERESPNRMEKRIPCKTAKERLLGNVQELERNHTPVCTK